MTKIILGLTAIVAVAVAVLGGRAMSAEDKYTVQIPNGLALSAIRGYEEWAVVSVSQPPGKLKMILANPTMIEAFKAGIPGNGKPFPDGSKSVKIIYSATKSLEAPFEVNVPDALQEVEFMEKDSKRFADGDGWGYAPFPYNAATGIFTGQGNDAKCGVACHKIASAKDYVFTEYARR